MGGRGNASYKTSTNRAPRQHQTGIPGEEMWVWLRLKLLADVGLLGLPNAGKSTFLNSVTNASAKVGDYPFTTLRPQLGVVRHKGREFVLADIPGPDRGRRRRRRHRRPLPRPCRAHAAAAPPRRRLGRGPGRGLARRPRRARRLWRRPRRQARDHRPDQGRPPRRQEARKDREGAREGIRSQGFPRSRRRSTKASSRCSTPSSSRLGSAAEKVDERARRGSLVAAMKLAVTGATGFVGSHLVDAALAAGHQSPL